MARKAAGAKDTDPDRLVRQRAGTYRTADDRFEVQQSATGWFLVDSQTTNEFGQAVMLGPFATLDAIRQALPDARKVTPISKRQRSVATKDAAATKAAAPPPPPPPRTWIDELAGAEATRVRALIRQLEREGVESAEELVRSDRDGLLPAIATRLIERRLEALIEESPPDERERARDLVRRAVEVLSADGTGLPAPLPRWAVLEIGPKGERDNRRIVLRRRR